MPPIRFVQLAAELGCQRIAVANLDKDPQRAIDGLGGLAEIAADREIEVSVEIGSMRAAFRLDRAIALARAVSMPNFALLIDTMHFFRLGSSLADLATVDPALIGYVQLCDVPLTQQFESYIDEALHERMAPGDGDWLVISCLSFTSTRANWNDRAWVVAAILIAVSDPRP
jgi:sugar phosphate isomerase/epimerase